LPKGEGLSSLGKLARKMQGVDLADVSGSNLQRLRQAEKRSSAHGHGTGASLHQLTSLHSRHGGDGGASASPAARSNAGEASEAEASEAASDLSADSMNPMELGTIAAAALMLQLGPSASPTATMGGLPPVTSGQSSKEI
jgi:hypothetical protein